MILSDKHKFIFLATPKTGSGTLHVLLSNHGWRSPIDVYANHLTADAARRLPRMMGNVKWEKYKKACFIRNPWDRYVALWLFIDPWRKQHKLPPHGSFVNYILNGGYDGQHQDEFLCHRDGSFTMDFVGKFEKIEEDIRRLFEFLKLPLPHKILHVNDFNFHLTTKNENKRKHYTEYYTEQWMIDAVAKREKVVIDKFGYKFGEDGDRWR
jgi:hypothetical protein